MICSCIEVRERSKKKTQKTLYHAKKVLEVGITLTWYHFINDLKVIDKMTS